MPSFVHITDGKTHESKVAKAHSFPKGCVVVVDRAYVDFAWMRVLDSNDCFFVTRIKSNMQYTLVKQVQSDALRSVGILADQVIELTGKAQGSTRERSCVWCGSGTAQKALSMSF